MESIQIAMFKQRLSFTKDHPYLKDSFRDMGQSGRAPRQACREGRWFKALMTN